MECYINDPSLNFPLLSLPIDLFFHHIVVRFTDRNDQINIRRTCKTLKTFVDATVWKQWVPYSYINQLPQMKLSVSVYGVFIDDPNPEPSVLNWFFDQYQPRCLSSNEFKGERFREYIVNFLQKRQVVEKIKKVVLPGNCFWSEDFLFYLLNNNIKLQIEDINPPFFVKSNLVNYCAKYGYIALLRALWDINKKLFVSCLCTGGPPKFSPLTIACRYNCETIVEFLLNKSFDLPTGMLVKFQIELNNLVNETYKTPWRWSYNVTSYLRTTQEKHRINAENWKKDYT